MPSPNGVPTADQVKTEMIRLLDCKDGICNGTGDGGIELGIALDEIVRRFKAKGFDSAQEIRRIRNLVNNLGAVDPFATKLNKKNLISICLKPEAREATAEDAAAVIPELGKAATQSELVKTIAESTGLPHSNVLTILQEFRKELVNALSDEGPGRFTITGVCTIEVQRPSNSDPIVTLRPHKELKNIGIIGDITSKN